MKFKTGMSVFRHIAAILILLGLDIHQKLRRTGSRTFLRATTGALSLSLLLMVIIGLVALRQVSRSVESLVEDSMIGVESSIAMRAVVRKTQVGLLRMQSEKDRRLTLEEMHALKTSMAELLRDYRKGVYSETDELNALKIEAKLSDYMQALQPIIENPNPEYTDMLSSEQAVRSLFDAIETAYQFNRQRIHSSAADARNSAKQALRIAYFLTWGFIAFIGTIILVYFAYRWLALPEELEI